MTTTDHAAEIAAAEATLAAAQADVERLRAQLTAEQGTEQTGPRLATWEDGVRAARARHPRRSPAGTDAGSGDAEGGAIPLEGAAAGRAAARRRGYGR